MQNPPTNTYYTNTRPEMLQYIPAQARTILDVGCATGIFGAAVKRQLPAAEVWGVEILPEVAAQARQHLDVVVNAPFDDAIDLPAQYFDAIVFNDSLEHLPDDRAALRLVKKFLKPETGRVVCSIPNVRYIDNLKHLLLEMDWRYEESGIRDKTHLRFFTRKSICRTFQETGYDIVQLEGINSDWWWGKKMRLIDWALKHRIGDTRFMQFAVIAAPVTTQQ